MRLAEFRRTVLAAVAAAAALAASADRARAVTYKGGVLAGDESWTPAMSPIELSSDLTVPSGVTLTIEPGVTVRAGEPPPDSFDVRDILVEGTLDARGCTFVAKAPAGDGHHLVPEQPVIGFEAASKDAAYDGAGNLLGGCVIRECDLYHFGVRIADSSPHISGNRFHSAAGGSGAALALRSDTPVRVAGNTFDKGPAAHVLCIGPSTAPSAHSICGNTFQDCDSAAVIEVAGSDAEITRNLFEGCIGCENGLLRLCGGFQRVEHNVFCDNETAAAAAILLNGDPKGGCPAGDLVARNNTVCSTTGGPAIRACGGVTEARNNIIAKNGAAGVRRDGTAAVYCAYNDCWANAGGDYAGCAAGTGAISADPIFADAPGGDFSLRAGSPCINAGDPADPVPPGGGLRIDIGAMEYLGRGVPAPTPTPAPAVKPRPAITPLPAPRAAKAVSGTPIVVTR